MLYSVDTIFHRQVVMGDADSEVAKYYIEQYRNGERQRPALDAQLYELEAEPGIPTAQRLSEITQQYSPDFTAAYLAHKLIEAHRANLESGEIDYLRPDAKSQVTVQ